MRLRAIHQVSTMSWLGKAWRNVRKVWGAELNMFTKWFRMKVDLRNEAEAHYMQIIREIA